MSIIRENLMSRHGYSPYCGNGKCCGFMPRSFFNGEQFECRACGWKSGFDAEFIKKYKEKWNV